MTAMIDETDPPSASAASVITDNGRRGRPLPGCDCEQCFGYCLIDGDERERAMFEIEMTNQRKEK